MQKLTEKPRETDREKLLYREADDDEEDAALLADMEGVDGDGDRGDARGGDEALSSDSEAEDGDVESLGGDAVTRCSQDKARHT